MADWRPRAGAGWKYSLLAMHVGRETSEYSRDKIGAQHLILIGEKHIVAPHSQGEFYENV